MKGVEGGELGDQRSDHLPVEKLDAFAGCAGRLSFKAQVTVGQREAEARVPGHDVEDPVHADAGVGAEPRFEPLDALTEEVAPDAVAAQGLLDDEQAQEAEALREAHRAQRGDEFAIASNAEESLGIEGMGRCEIAESWIPALRGCPSSDELEVLEGEWNDGLALGHDLLLLIAF